ncbi:MAG: polysaccharide deacetylase family protein [Bacteroidales bacterium]|jgi:peptidoglycan/xylan/chitin deacetylase (PgdA/CDA1 family)
MSTNEKANLTFAFVLLLLVTGWWFWQWSLWWMVLPLVVLMITKILGSIFIQCNFYLHSFCRKKTDQKLISLTFDDGPDEILTAQLLDLLDEFGAKATFFVTGQKAKKNPELIKLIHKKGHLLGNHSYSHSRFFDLFNARRMRNELLWTHEQIYKITGLKTLIFRPPYGVSNPILARTIKQLGYFSIGWSVRSLDTMKTADQTLERLIAKTHSGAIVLLHDTSPEIVKITRNYLEWLQTNRYQIVPLNQLLSINVYD